MVTVKFVDVELNTAVPCVKMHDILVTALCFWLYSSPPLTGYEATSRASPALCPVLRKSIHEIDQFRWHPP